MNDEPDRDTDGMLQRAWDEVSRLTAELAAARARILALESQHRWRSVAEEKPAVQPGWFAVVGDDRFTCVVQLDGTNVFPPGSYWLGPLPALPPADPEPTT